METWAIPYEAFVSWGEVGVVVVAGAEEASASGYTLIVDNGAYNGADLQGGYCLFEKET